MRKFDIEKRLHRTLQKLSKKDSKRYEIIWKKIQEVINSGNTEHYKNLKHDLKDFKRIHIDKSFVLIFKHDKVNNKIIFYDFDHHDNIYIKKH